MTREDWIKVEGASAADIERVIRYYASFSERAATKPFTAVVWRHPDGFLTVAFPERILPYHFMSIISWLNDYPETPATRGAVGWLTSPGNGTRYRIGPEFCGPLNDAICVRTADGRTFQAYNPDGSLCETSERLPPIEEEDALPNGSEEVVRFTFEVEPVLMDGATPFGNPEFVITHPKNHAWYPLPPPSLGARIRSWLAGLFKSHEKRHDDPFAGQEPVTFQKESSGTADVPGALPQPTAPDSYDKGAAAAVKRFFQMATGQEPDDPVITNADVLRQLNAREHKLASCGAFVEWATAAWDRWSADGPGAIKPLRAGNAQGTWHGREMGFYALLYPVDAFDDLVTFGLYESYASSIEQSLCWDGEVDMSMFYPPERDDAIKNAIKHWRRIGEVFAHADLVARLNAWPLPESLHWVRSLNFDRGIIWESDEEGDLNARAAEGYLRLFVLDG